ncbi:MAG: FG-GAP-like repeat-containing protein [Cyclobacteriaceae bacterium]|nr:FG-GAP-like repeat-containing protein [Cyclobacteriaceae bacterium]
MKQSIGVFLSLFLCAAFVSNGQAPVIQKIEPSISFSNATIVITGSGFSTNSSQLQVWFDHVRGRIISSSNSTIEVEVPPQAKLDNIRVVNTNTKLSTQSGAKYMPVFSGEGFDPAKLNTPVSKASANNIADLISIDIDGDNKPDLIGTRNQTTATSLSLFMNQTSVGNITSANMVDTTIPSLNINAPTSFLTAGDINGDGKPDIVASRGGTTTNSVFVLINNSTVGNPVFLSPTVLFLDAGHVARQVEIEDLNNDGKPEIIVANGTTNELYIFKNESSGGATTINSTPTKITVTGASVTYALDIQDFNGDGKKDIIATQFQANNLFVLRNNSTATSFAFDIIPITISGALRDVGSADFNNDGKIDIVAVSFFTPTAVFVFINQSTATTISFAAPVTITTDTQPWSIDTGDLNGDGFADFIVACSATTNTLNAYLSNGSLTALNFTKVVINSGKKNYAVRAGDLDGDSKPDIYFSTSVVDQSNGPFSVEILRNLNCHKPKILNESPLTICASQTIRLNAIAMPGVTYNWSNGFSSIKNGTDPFADISVAATYTVTATSEGGACTVVSNPIVINPGAGSAPALPVITTNAPVCVGNPITISTTAISGATYKWTGPNNFTSTLQTINIAASTQANAGTYSLTVKVGDCTSNEATKLIELISAPSFTISSSNANNTICEGQSLTLTVNSETGYTYQWIKDGTAISGQTGISLNVTAKGDYKVKATNTGLGCTTETLPTTVNVLKVPSASFTMPTEGCVDNSISFNSSSSVIDPLVTTPIFGWDFGDNTSSTVPNPEHTYTAAATYIVKLTISYSNVTGCTNSVTKNLPISTATTPVITATATEICPGESSTLSLAGTYQTYQWSNNQTTPTISVTTPDTYTVTTTEANGCIGEAQITIDTKTDCPIAEALKFPVAFTPNGDSNNDRWVINGIEQFGECTMNIFDGRGRRIFQVTGYPIEGWDGTYQGKEVPDGTYFFAFGCPNEKAQTGSVLIVR